MNSIPFFEQHLKQLMSSSLHIFLIIQLGHFSMHVKYLIPNLFILEMLYEKTFDSIV
ncbi:hypothetical protein RhiirA5_367646 [Rhizophagus irregularis]|uniref:Uncharacterized protein n=1 Tax=Rhizophagus irregularis TaxID=588596 RepID=A0A2N0NQI5_9GLOM|nr:hypothetical protein RhiirA5_367646 [Rhizophagus irregularis]